MGIYYYTIKDYIPLFPTKNLGSMGIDSVGLMETKMDTTT